jgi:superfamily II DNA or RNA helicase
LQQVGRVLRKSNEPSTAIILDHAGNALRHGLPCQNRQFTLAGKKKRKRHLQSQNSVRICPMCYGAQNPNVKICRYCSHVFIVKSRMIEQVEGDLVEVQRLKKIDMQKRAKTFSSLIALGKTRGYKNPYAWARYVFQSRQKRFHVK